ncbi:MAG: NADP oxidoreductase [Anaerolineales bacterium]|nr:NADP oxidoreductase [Anaerolineales bacterium]MCB9128445.1 NADP oxidoreductase [Ardenticatenales bacterium]
MSTLQPENPSIERRIALQRVGRIDPESIDDYLAEEGFVALRQLLQSANPDSVIEAVTTAGVRGHGGAGFPTGRKWYFVAKADAPVKYVVCNADESEPGTLKDRLIMEGDPFSLIEAMIIAGFTVGATTGFIYLRGEYNLARHRLENAIRQAEAAGFLGRDILGSGIDFSLHLHSGAGAYICGEETALISSLEGYRGEPRSKPPYPTQSGLWGRPTLVNNVETLVRIPPILRHGAAWYRASGTAGSPGTQIVTLLGDVNWRGVVEVPFGISTRRLIDDVGQGVKGGALKLVQSGGSSGGIIPPEWLDLPLDFDSGRAGVVLGSGALLVCNAHRCVVDLTTVVMAFFRAESCGKCVPCRVGTVELHTLLQRLTEGRGTLRDLSLLETMGAMVKRTSFCGLGITAPNVLLDGLRHFRDEYIAHARDHRCPAAVCAMQDSAWGELPHLATVG